MAVRDADPLIGFQFAIEINGMTGYFTEVNGIISDNAVATHKVVTTNAKEVVLQVPGRCDGGELTLKRGLTTNIEFWTWRELAITGNLAEARVDGSIVMFNRQYEEVRRWNFINGWPSKLSGPTIAADSNDLAIEELTIVHEGLYADAPGISSPNRAPD
ncbi:MAG: phage tail protein [Caldilineaceae bacterium]|nr:phage tail protein [Caldilineaceae bacterium]